MLQLPQTTGLELRVRPSFVLHAAALRPTRHIGSDQNQIPLAFAERRSADFRLRLGADHGSDLAQEADSRRLDLGVVLGAAHIHHHALDHHHNPESGQLSDAFPG